MPFVDTYEKHVVCRLLDFYGSRTGWERRLWESGIVLTLREVLEASEGVRQGVLTTESLGELTSYAATLVGLDPGTGAAQTRRTLQSALKKSMVPKGADYSIVQQFAQEIGAAYISNLVGSLGASKPRAERMARCIASHLLDAGFSPEKLHRWCLFHDRNGSGAKNLAELLEDAQNIASRPQQTFKVLVGFHSVPPNKQGMPENWLSPEDSSKWLQSNGIATVGIRLNGSMLFHVTARDVWSALRATVENVEHLTSRVALGAERPLRSTGQAWVQGEAKTFDFKPENRSVQVHALHRNDKLYVAGTSNIVDAALELLGALNSGPASSAVAAGWAAIEAVLKGPGDSGVLAADRMAALVACSLVRAELTHLSYRIQELGGSLARELEACATNRDRAELIALAIQAGTRFPLNSESDGAAISRITEVLADPHVVLRDVQNHLNTAFRRLYRIRNLVMHGGMTEAVGLSASLRTVAPLVGAGMDRIAHAWFVEGVRPMELAARATIRLSIVASPGAPSAVDLLSRS